MTITRRVAVAALTLALSACATGWVKPGSSEQDLVTDKASCEQEADAAFATGGRLQAVTSAVDKRGAFDRCMIARGWRDKEGRIASTAPRSGAPASAPLYLPGYSR